MEKVLNHQAESVVVITGASSGIGRATALEFARQGQSVVLAARRQEALSELAEECKRIGGQAIAVPTDVSREEEVNHLAATALKAFGRIDVWVNNAGVYLLGRLDEVPMTAMRKVIETNFFGYIYGARAVLPHFRKRGRGILINISSMAGATGEPYATAYSASKSAIRGLSRSLEQELVDEENIHICCVLPAVVDTPIFKQAANYMGMAIKPAEPVIHAQKVADAIVKLTKEPRKEITVGVVARVAPIVQSISPNIFDRKIKEKVDEDHFKDQPAPPTEGNLFEPLPEWTGISGGWKEEDPIGPAISNKQIALTGLGIAGIAFGTYLALRKRK